MRKYLFLTAILLVALLTACERTIDSNDPVRSLPDPAPKPTNIQVLINSASVAPDWTMTDSSNVAKYRVYVTDSLPDDFRIHDSSTHSAITMSDLLLNHLYYFQVVAVDRSGLEGMPSEPVSATIGYSSITINGGAPSTTDLIVTVGVNSSAPVLMVVLSEDPTFAGAAYVSYAPELSFFLSSSEGVKIVYGRLIFADGSETGELLEDSIILTTPPAVNSN